MFLFNLLNISTCFGGLANLRLATTSTLFEKIQLHPLGGTAAPEVSNTARKIEKENKTPRSTAKETSPGGTSATLAAHPPN